MRARSATSWLLLFALAGSPTPSRAAEPASLAIGTSPVARSMPATLRFLRSHRDFLSARFAQSPTAPRVARERADALDPRFTSYRSLLAGIAAAKDSVGASALARDRETLFANVGRLEALERELDQMERVLDAQQSRLAWLRNDFAGRQRTELVLLVTGGTLAGRLDSVVVTLEDGSRSVAALDETQRRSLRPGGWLELHRGLVEPREQTLELRFKGEGWDASGPGFVTFAPARDRLTFVQLDLSQAAPARGVAGASARTWTLDGADGPARADSDRDQP